MSIESTSEIREYLFLQKKSEIELRAICEAMELPIDGSKDKLIESLISLNFKAQNKINKPQAIPLRTKKPGQGPMDTAIEAIRQWRKTIFQQRDKRKFTLFNNQGKAYSLNLKYITLDNETINQIIENEWTLINEKNRDLFLALRSKPSEFECNIIQKPDKKGNSWIMLHIAPRKAA